MALSGGADSACLAAIMSVEEGVSVRAHHIRHGLREDDGRDAAIARNLAQLLGIEFIQTDLSWPDGIPSSNVEEQAREARYGALVSALDGKPHAALAVAHHGDENLETAIWRLGRGCGIEGLTLASSRSLGNIRMIRPLLMASKAEIYDFMKEVGLAWAEDPTNQSDAYRRNRIRHEILPQIKAEASSEETLFRSLTAIRHDADALDDLASNFVKSQRMLAGCWFCPWNAWNELGRSSACQILRHAARLVIPGYCPDYNFIVRSADVVSERRQSCRQVENGRLHIGWTHGGVMVWSDDERQENLVLELDVPCSDLDVWHICRLSAWRSLPETPLRNTTSAFHLNAEEMTGKFSIEPASRFSEVRTATGNLCRVREALRRQGIPEHWQKQWPVLCCDGRPIWFFGGMRTLEAKPAQAGQTAISFIVSWKS